MGKNPDIDRPAMRFSNQAGIAALQSLQDSLNDFKTAASKVEAEVMGCTDNLGVHAELEGIKNEISMLESSIALAIEELDTELRALED